MEKELRELIKLVLPKELLEHFNIKKVKSKGKRIEIEAEEKNNPPIVKGRVQSKGFYPAKEVEDFPIRGKSCVLRIRRRKWIEEGREGILKREIKLVHRGTRLVLDFAFFFKGRDRERTKINKHGSKEL